MLRKQHDLNSQRCTSCSSRDLIWQIVPEIYFRNRSGCGRELLLSGKQFSNMKFGLAANSSRSSFNKKHVCLNLSKNQ